MTNKEDVARTIADAAYAYLEAAWPMITAPAPRDAAGNTTDEELIDPAAAAHKKIVAVLKDTGLIKDEAELAGIGDATGGETYPENYRELIDRRAAQVAENPVARNQLLGILDMLWMTNLEDLEALQEAVGLRAYGQRDPLVEYRQEASKLFHAFWGNFNGWIFGNMFKTAAAGATAGGAGQASHIHVNAPRVVVANAGGEAIGRNDPCPCGSGKKWKKCGLLNTEEHQQNMAKKSNAKHEVIGG